MVDLHIPKSKYTPEVNFSVDGVFVIEGISLVEDATLLYSEIIAWLMEFGQEKVKPIVLSLKFYYLDTSSVRSVVDIVRTIDLLHEKGFQTNIAWYYEKTDHDLYEVGQGIQSTCKGCFNLVEIQIDDLNL